MAARRPSKRSARHRAAKPAAREVALAHDPATALAMRQLFWFNVVREMLTAMAVRTSEAQRAAESGAMPEGAGAPLNGQMSIITRLGARLPVAAVIPMVAANPAARGEAKALAMLVQCSVFQIVTTDGEQWILPIHEVASFQAISEQAAADIERANLAARDDRGEPFGFAAFTSLARGQGIATPADSADRPPLSHEFGGE